MHRFLSLAVLAIALCIISTESAKARRYQRVVIRTSSFGRARPVTGYGANIHRNFILKQEARRVQQGKRVRNRGNIAWYRF